MTHIQHLSLSLSLSLSLAVIRTHSFVRYVSMSGARSDSSLVRSLVHVWVARRIVHPRAVEAVWQSVSELHSGIQRIVYERGREKASCELAPNVSIRCLMTDEFLGRADVDLKQFINQYEAEGGGTQTSKFMLQPRQGKEETVTGMITLDLSFSYE
mgnify:CR=1 FL=1